MRHQSQFHGKLKRKRDIVTGPVHVQNQSPNLVPLPILDHGDGIVQDLGPTAQEGVLAPDVGHLLEGEVPPADCLPHLDTREAEVQLDVEDALQHLCLEAVAHRPPPDPHHHHLLRSSRKEFPLAHHASQDAHLHLSVLPGDDIDSLHLQAHHKKGVLHRHSSHPVQERLGDRFHLFELQHQNTKL